MGAAVLRRAWRGLRAALWVPCALALLAVGRATISLHGSFRVLTREEARRAREVRRLLREDARHRRGA